MPDTTLLLLVTEVRDKTLRILDGVGEVDALWTPRSTNNHILWHAGHAFALAEALVLAPATGRAPAYPEGWFDAFSWKSIPANVQNWPTLADVVGRLREQLAQMTAAVESLDPARLETNVGTPDRPRTLRYSILHGLHDEACHQGEIHLLKKLLARR